MNAERWTLGVGVGSSELGVEYNSLGAERWTLCVWVGSSELGGLNTIRLALITERLAMDAGRKM